jgi:hypothetical protein
MTKSEGSIHYYRDAAGDRSGKRHFELHGIDKITIDALYDLLIFNSKDEGKEKALFTGTVKISENVEEEALNAKIWLPNKEIASQAKLDMTAITRTAMLSEVNTFSNHGKGLSTVLRSLLAHVFFNQKKGAMVTGLINEDNNPSIRARYQMSDPEKNYPYQTHRIATTPKSENDNPSIHFITTNNPMPADEIAKALATHKQTTNNEKINN